jgi:hypothetical protein
MKHMQFKFDPLSAESTHICQFLEGWLEFFFMQTTSELFIKYGIISFKIVLVHF